MDLMLTPAERRVAELVALGLADKVIAQRLGLAPGTVKIHLHRVYKRLGITNRTALALAYLQSLSELQPRHAAAVDQPE